MKEYIFKLTDKVRDYECDLQGVGRSPFANVLSTWPKHTAINRYLEERRKKYG